MATNNTTAKPLICPACFAREIDPVMLHFDEEESEYYCQHCGYTAPSAQVVQTFIESFILCRHGIDIRNSKP